MTHGHNIDKAMRIAGLSMAFGEVDRATEHPDGRSESDTTHTVMLALLCLELAPPEIACDAAVFAIVHDLLERWALDVCTAWGLTESERADKQAREAAAMLELERLGLDHITRLVKLYEAQDTRAARFVRYLDKVTPKLTHLLNGGSALRRIGMTAADMRAKHHDQGQQLAAQYPEQQAARELFAAACDRCEAELSDALEDDDFPWGAVRFTCPICRGETSADSRDSLEPEITHAATYLLNPAVLDDVAARAEDTDAYEIVFLPSAPDGGTGERVVEGVRYEYLRAWLFSCPLCRGETPLNFGYWQRTD